MKIEKEIVEHGLTFNRRRFLSKISLGLGSVALGSLLIPDLFKRNELEEGAFSSPFTRCGFPRLPIVN